MFNLWLFDIWLTLHIQPHGPKGQVIYNQIMYVKHAFVIAILRFVGFDLCSRGILESRPLTVSQMVCRGSSAMVQHIKPLNIRSRFGSQSMHTESKLAFLFHKKSEGWNTLDSKQSWMRHLSQKITGSFKCSAFRLWRIWFKKFCLILCIMFIYFCWKVRNVLKTC